MKAGGCDKTGKKDYKKTGGEEFLPLIFRGDRGQLGAASSL